MRRLMAFCGGLIVTFVFSPCLAQSPADFYRGKTIDLYIGTTVGGGYDAYSRMLARYIGRHIPGNPNVVPKNMEGGGGVRLANFLYNAAPKDGTAFGTFNRGVSFEPLLNNRPAQFEATRFNWLGSTNNEVSVCVAWHTHGVTRYEDMLTRELLVGASGPSADTYHYPKIVNAVLGTKFKIITGYPGGNDIDLAMERQEVQGRCSWSWTSVKATHQPWLDQRKINILFQIGFEKHPDLPRIPLVLDLARNDEERAIFKLVFGRQVMAWPFTAPPGLPPDRLAMLRKAFMDTMQDRDFLNDAAKANFEVRPVEGAAIQKLVGDIYDTPRPIVQKTTQFLQ